VRITYVTFEISLTNPAGSVVYFVAGEMDIRKLGYGGGSRTVAEKVFLTGQTSRLHSFFL